MVRAGLSSGYNPLLAGNRLYRTTTPARADGIIVRDHAPDD
jgi:hypothetical protein